MHILHEVYVSYKFVYCGLLLYYTYAQNKTKYIHIIHATHAFYNDAIHTINVILTFQEARVLEQEALFRQQLNAAEHLMRTSHANLAETVWCSYIKILPIFRNCVTLKGEWSLRSILFRVLLYVCMYACMHEFMNVCLKFDAYFFAGR